MTTSYGGTISIDELAGIRGGENNVLSDAEHQQCVSDARKTWYDPTGPWAGGCDLGLKFEHFARSYRTWKSKHP
jgi:hypothetical protein